MSKTLVGQISKSETAGGEWVYDLVADGNSYRLKINGALSSKIDKALTNNEGEFKITGSALEKDGTWEMTVASAESTSATATANP